MATLIWSLTHACPEEWRQRFEKLAIPTLHIPFVRVELVSDLRAVDTSLRMLESYDGIIFTSRHAVRFTRDRLDALSVEMSIPVYCVGSSTARESESLGLTPSWVADEYSGKGLATMLAERLTTGDHLLFPKSTKSNDAPWRILRKKDIHVHGINLYAPHVINYEKGAEVRKLLADESLVIAFGSPSAVNGWVNIWDSPSQAATVLEHSFVCAIGGATSQALQRIGTRPDIVPKKPTANGLCLAISQAMERRAHEPGG